MLNHEVGRVRDSLTQSTMQQTQVLCSRMESQFTVMNQSTSNMQANWTMVCMIGGLYSLSRPRRSILILRIKILEEWQVVSYESWKSSPAPSEDGKALSVTSTGGSDRKG